MAKKISHEGTKSTKKKRKEKREKRREKREVRSEKREKEKALLAMRSASACYLTLRATGIHPARPSPLGEVSRSDGEGPYFTTFLPSMM